MVLFSKRVCSTSVIHFAINEESNEGQFVGNVKTESNVEINCQADSRPDLTFEFRPTTTNYQLFRINSKTGVLTTGEVIDRESICEFRTDCDIELDIKVSPFQCFTIIKVIVTIRDINDHAPRFPEARITRSVVETSMVGTLIPIPSAADEDSDVFSIDNYKLITQNSDFRKFELHITEHSDHTMDLNIALLERLDREETSRYELTVIAYDGDTPPKSGSVVILITVTDANDNAPQFDNNTYDVTVSENLQAGSVIIQVCIFSVYKTIVYNFTNIFNQY